MSAKFALSFIFVLLVGIVAADQLHKLQKAQTCGEWTKYCGNHRKSSSWKRLDDLTFALINFDRRPSDWDSRKLRVGALHIQAWIQFRSWSWLCGPRRFQQPHCRCDRRHRRASRKWTIHPRWWVAADNPKPNLINSVDSVLAPQLPWPGFNKNACNGNGITCPVKKGQKYTYRYSDLIKPAYPKANLKFEWKLRDASNNMAFCFGTQLKLE